MKNKLPGISNKEKITQLQEGQPAKIIETKESKGKVYFKVAMSLEFYSELYEFLKQNSLTYWGNDKKVIPLFLEYGLSEESSEGLGKYQNNLLKVSSRYGAINFLTSDYYAKNQAVVVGLRIHLMENKSLKRKMKANGLGNYVSEDEWDNWDDAYISQLYRKYVFGK